MPAQVRAKFFVREITRYPGDPTAAGGKVVMGPVSRGAVNASFASATPGGEIVLHVQNPGALATFDGWRENKREFYVDFTEYTPVAGDGHAFVLTEGNSHYNRGKCVECGGAEEDH